MADSVGGFALMRCVGMSWKSIVLYQIALICVVIACIVAIPPAIPDRVWENCRICARSEPRVTNVNGRERRTTQCVEHRQGTPRECKERGRVIEYVLATIVGIVLAALISASFNFYLKSKVYTTTGLLGETALRTIF